MLLVPTQSTSERTREAAVFGSGKESGVARDGVGGSFYCMPLCAFGMLCHGNEFPIHKNK